MIGFGDDTFPAMETGVSLRIAGNCQVPDTHVHPDHAALGSWVGYVHFECDQQVELLARLVIPEFRCPDGGTVLKKDDVSGVARVGQNHSALKRQDAHPALRLETVVMPQLIFKRRGGIFRGSIQALVAFLRTSGFARRHILLDRGPEALVGGSHLPGNGAGHLRRYLVPQAYLAVGAVLQPDLVAHLAVFKGIVTHKVEARRGRPVGSAAVSGTGQAWCAT
jgi:hypothetical protein